MFVVREGGLDLLAAPGVEEIEIKLSVLLRKEPRNVPRCPLTTGAYQALRHLVIQVKHQLPARK